MNNEETYLKKTYGTESYFSVPEGYFDRFASQLMEQLPEQSATTATEPSAKVIPMKSRFAMSWRRYVAAACICGAIISGGWLFFSQQQQESAPLYSSQQSVSNETVINEAADYMMLDNEDIYTYLADY